MPKRKRGVPNDNNMFDGFYNQRRDEDENDDEQDDVVMLTLQQILDYFPYNEMLGGLAKADDVSNDEIARLHKRLPRDKQKELNKMYNRKKLFNHVVDNKPKRISDLLGAFHLELREDAKMCAEIATYVEEQQARPSGFTTLVPFQYSTKASDDLKEKWESPAVIRRIWSPFLKGVNYKDFFLHQEDAQGQKKLVLTPTYGKALANMHFNLNLLELFQLPKQLTINVAGKHPSTWIYKKPLQRDAIVQQKALKSIDLGWRKSLDKVNCQEYHPPLATTQQWNTREMEVAMISKCTDAEESEFRF